MEIELSPELQAKLDRIASQQGRDSKSLVHEAVERLIGYDEWFVRQVEKGLEQTDRGELLEHEDVAARIGKFDLPRTASGLMRVRWTPAATDDLQNIANYLFEKTPEHAPGLIRKLYTAPSSLASFPNRGRVSKKEGTRELVLPSLPYMIIYNVRGDTIHVVRVLHGSQEWPS